MNTGIYNIESCVDINGNPYIMEVSPRGGGCKIAELQRFAFGIDLIEAEVRNAIGLPLNSITQTDCDGCWCEMVIHAHSNESGIFEEIIIDPEIEKRFIKMIELSKKTGEMIYPFTGANMAIGDLFIRTDSRSELNQLIAEIDKWFKIKLK